MAEPSYFQDEAFQDSLVAMLCKDAQGLRTVARFLSREDFRPVKGLRNGQPRWTVAELALEHYRKHREPLGRLLMSTVIEHANSLNLGEHRIQQLKEYCDSLSATDFPSPDAITEKVLRYKGERKKEAVIEELKSHQVAGTLTDDKWRELSQQAILVNGNGNGTVDYVAGLQDRLDRRKSPASRVHRPWTMIDPLDSRIQGLGPKELGLIIAPYKRGKSLMLQWLAVSYVLQSLDVLYITLENPQSAVEDRLDSITTNIPIKSLIEKPNLTTQRFQRFRSMVTKKLKIYDGTMGGVSVPYIESLLLAERDKGFFPDALIIDYDDEIAPTTKQKERRFEFSDIYRDLRQMTARHNLITWTAAQTQRDTEHLKIISGDRAAEDISKLRKVSLAISMGKGDWENGESIYLWVAAANNDVQHVGCHIMPDRKRMLVFDREATERAAKRNGGQT